jgi:hypothetical protein
MVEMGFTVNRQIALAYLKNNLCRPFENCEFMDCKTDCIFDA